MANGEKKSKTKIILICIGIVLVLIITGIVYAYSVCFGDIETVKITEDSKELKIEPKVAEKSGEIINVALFGIDTRANDYDGSRADTIMIASLDTIHKKIKITSIMRDSFVDIPGQGYDKINHSYAFGGPELSVQTLNQNFDMNIKDYVTVNFSALQKIVDTVGGVDIDIKSYEIDHISGINEVGVHNLNGEQALSYSRIRYSGDGDYERTQRQRVVIENVINKVLNNKSLPQALGLIDTLGPYIQTSFETNELVGLATTVFSTGITTLEDTRLPLDGKAVGGLWNGVYYLKPNTLSENVTYLHEFIFEEPGYIPSQTVEEISNMILSTI
jgi:LCP family protein required for cell wall assembly